MYLKFVHVNTGPVSPGRNFTRADQYERCYNFFGILSLRAVWGRTCHTKTIGLKTTPGNRNARIPRRLDGRVRDIFFFFLEIFHNLRS